NLFPRQWLVHLPFGDRAIRTGDLDAGCFRGENPDKAYTSTQPLRNLCLPFRRGVVGGHGPHHPIWGETTRRLRGAVCGSASAAVEGYIGKADPPRVLSENLIPTICLKDQSQIMTPYKVPDKNEYIGRRITGLCAQFALH